MASPGVVASAVANRPTIGQELHNYFLTTKENLAQALGRYRALNVAAKLGNDLQSLQAILATDQQLLAAAQAGKPITLTATIGDAVRPSPGNPSPQFAFGKAAVELYLIGANIDYLQSDVDTLQAVIDDLQRNLNAGTSTQVGTYNRLTVDPGGSGFTTDT